MNGFGNDSSQPLSLSQAIKKSANEMLFHTLLNNPDKRAKVLELLTQEGLVDENLSPNSAKSNKYNSPIKRLQKNDGVLNHSPKAVRLESPSALGRRRALQRLESDSSTEQLPPKVPSPQFTGTPKPFDSLLTGVVAYCEIRSNGEDRSAAIKTMMETMGAKIKDNLCKGVTHVILKDGLYTTYRKAKLMKIHVVSVLWLEAVRRHKFRVPETKFPAVCADAYEADLTKIFQDYDDVIQDELNKTTEWDNRRRSETPMKYITNRRKSTKSRSTMYSSDCSLYKDAHNRTEAASSFKKKCDNPELSDSDSYISVGSTSSKHNDIVPCSQDAPTYLSICHNKTTDLTNTPEGESDENLPETNLAKHVKDSFELEKASKIRSPDSLINKSKQKVVNHTNKESSGENDDSLRLHISTTDDSNLNSTGNRSKSNNSSSFQNQLGGITPISRKKATDISSSDDPSIKLYISEESKSSATNQQNNVDTSRPSSRNSTVSSDVDINKNKTRRRTTVGLKRPSKKNSVDSPKTPTQNQKTPKIKSVSSVIEINDSTDNLKQSEVKNKTNSTTDDNQFVTIRKSRRKTFANLNTTENKNVETEEEITESEKNYSETDQSTIRKSRRKTLANLAENKTKSVEVEETTEPENNSESDQSTIRKSRRKTFANLTENKTKSVEIEETTEPENNSESDQSAIRKSRRKTLANLTENKTKSVEIEETTEPENNSESDQSAIRNSRRKTLANLTENKTKSVAINEVANEQPENSNSETDQSTIRKSRKTKTVVINEELNKQKDNSSSDSSADKTKRRVRKLFNPNQSISASQIIWDDEPELEPKSVRVSPPKKGKYQVPVKDLPKILSAKAEKKIKSTTKKATAKSVPAKNTNYEPRNKRKSARALNFNSTSSESDAEILKPPPTVETPSRRSERIARTPVKSTPRTPKKPLHTQMLKTDENNRRSTLDFVPIHSKKSLEQIKLSQKPKPVRLPGIVCTRFHKSDVQVFQQIVAKLGGFVVENEVTKRTTHLVAGGLARTVNLLRAIARGCWVVKQEWLYKSLEAGRWLQEEEFELVEFSPAVQKCRVEKDAFGPLFSMDLFKSCGRIFISRGSNPRFSDLEELVELCEGRVVRIAKDAQIVVGEHSTCDGVICVNEKWILDSITQNKLKKCKGYLIQRPASPDL